MMTYHSKAHRCLNSIAEELARLDKPEIWRIARIYDLVDEYYEFEARRFNATKKSELKKEGDEAGTGR